MNYSIELTELAIADIEKHIKSGDKKVRQLAQVSMKKRN